MKFVSAFTVLFAAVLVCWGRPLAPGQTENAERPFSLTISVNPPEPLQDDTSDKSIHPGSGLTVRIRKTNITDHEIPKVGPDNGPFGYIFDARDGDGNPAPPHKSTGAWPTSGGSAPVLGTKDMVLQPGESKIDFATPSEWYDLSKPGIYTVQVSQHVAGDPTSAIVKSNKVTVTVAP